MARMLKGNIHEDLGERAQRAFNESVEAARAGQQKLDAIWGDSTFIASTRRSAAMLGGPPQETGRPPQ